MPGYEAPPPPPDANRMDVDILAEELEKAMDEMNVESDQDKENQQNGQRRQAAKDR